MPTFAQGQAGAGILLDLAIDTTGEEASWATVAVEVSNLQNLGWSAGEGNCIGVNWGKDVVASGGVEDALIINDTAGIEAVAGCRDGVDDAGHIGTILRHNIAILDEGSPDVASVVSLNGQDT